MGLTQGSLIYYTFNMPGLGLSLRLGRNRKTSKSISETVIAALEAKASSEGYTAFSEDVKDASLVLVQDLVNAGIWNNLDVFYVFKTDGDSDFATINWIDPDNFQIIKENSPTFTTKDGFAGDGVSAALNTNYNLSNNGVNYTLNSASAGYFTNTNVAELRTVGSGSSRLVFTPNFNNSVGYFRINATSPSTITVSSLTNLGLVVANRSASNEENLYVDGVSIYSGTTASTGVDQNNLYGLRVLTGYAQSNFTLQLMFAGGSMKDKIVDFSNIVNDYMDKL